MSDTTRVSGIASAIAGIEIEVIVGGALMRVTFTEGTNPATVPQLLRELDPGAQFREAFYSRGAGAARTTLQARALVITVEGRGDMVFVKITATNADGEDLTISVPKKKSTDWLPAVEALGKLSERALGKLKVALETRKAATAILGEAEQFGVAYWKADDGAAYMDSMTAEPPAIGAPA
jgi:hypothetical protein